MNKIANIPLGDDKELNVGRLGGYISAPIVSGMATKLYVDMVKARPRILALWNTTGPQAIGNKIRIALPIAAASSLMGAIGYAGGYAGGRVAEKFLVVPKKDGINKTAEDNKKSHAGLVAGASIGGAAGAGLAIHKGVGKGISIPFVGDAIKKIVKKAIMNKAKTVGKVAVPAAAIGAIAGAILGSGAQAASGHSKHAGSKNLLSAARRHAREGESMGAKLVGSVHQSEKVQGIYEGQQDEDAREFNILDYLPAYWK